MVDAAALASDRSPAALSYGVRRVFKDSAGGERALSGRVGDGGGCSCEGWQ